MNTSPPKPHYGVIKTASELGDLLRAFRKQKHLTLEKVADLTQFGTRFLSELERGKETAELGKALTILNKIGLEIILQPRGTYLSQQQKTDHFNDEK